MNSVVDLIQTSQARYLEELTALLAIPSVSALPEHAGDVRRCAEWVADHMRGIGLEQVRLADTPGHPVVYGHYDVQPVDPLDQWTTPPFEATVRDQELFARGAADDKGQLFIHLKAIEAHLRQRGRLPVNVKVILEGEEEAGSTNLDAFIRENRDLLAADVVVISDTPMFDRGVPAICYGLRGLTYFQVDLRGTRSDLHSGSFGGAVANPAFVLAQLLAQMKDRSGHVRIPGFYDEVRSLTEQERAEFGRLPFSEKQYRDSLGAPRLFGEAGYSTLERVWARPTFEVNGLLAGFTGEGTKTVIPATAMAKVSMRLVPDQDPERIGDLFEAFVKRTAPKTVGVTVTRMHGGRPWKTELDNPYVQAAARAFEIGFGKRPVYTREGGSIPIVSVFQDQLGAPTVLFGIGVPDENAHAPNEKLDLGHFFGGILSAAYLLEEISRIPR